ITVITQGTGVPVGNANIDLINVQTGSRLITVGDVTAANGFARLVSDDALYHIKVSPPTADYDTAYVPGQIRTLSDTAITVIMRRHGVLAVEPPAPRGLSLASPWPNPAHGQVRFAFAGRGTGELTIVDILGRVVATPWRGTLGGEGTAGWEARDDAGHVVPSG